MSDLINNLKEQGAEIKARAKASRSFRLKLMAGAFLVLIALGVVFGG